MNYIISLNYMLSHKEGIISEEEKKSEPIVGNSGLVTSTEKITTTEIANSEPSLKELMEKNLKWSQIIYEQNRKINNKLLWSAIANWVKVLLIAIPLALGILYLPPLFKGVVSQYGDLLENTHSTSTQQNYLDIFLKWFNLDPAKQEQIKTLLK